MKERNGKPEITHRNKLLKKPFYNGEHPVNRNTGMFLTAFIFCFVIERICWILWLFPEFVA